LGKSTSREEWKEKGLAGSCDADAFYRVALNVISEEREKLQHA